MDIRAFSFEIGMWFHFYVDNQVTGLSSLSCISFFAHSEIYTVVYTFRNVYLLFNCTMLCATTSACHAWGTNYSACTITVSTGLLYYKGSLFNCLKTLTTTTSTSTGRRSRFSFSTLTCLAHIWTIERNGFLATLNCFHKVNFKI